MQKIRSLPSNRVLEKDSVSTDVREIEHERNHGRMGSFLVKVFRRKSKDNDRGPVTTRSIETGVVEVNDHSTTILDEAHSLDTPAAGSSPRETTTIDGTATTSADVDSSTNSRRSRAEIRLHKSAEALNQAISSISGSFRVPDSIGLQNVEDNIDNIPQTARGIEAAIDGFIDKREYKLSMDSRAVWRSCAANLFKAFYPYLKSCFSDIGNLVPTPYGLAISGVLFLLQFVYDAVKLDEDVQGAVSELSAIMRRVEVTEGFKDILDEAQLDEVYCDALALSACVTEYLTMSIMYLQGGFVTGFFASARFKGAKKNIEDAVSRYKESMGYLTVSMTAELLHHDKAEKREKILEWIWKGDYWTKHKNLRDRRVPNTGKGFVEDERIQAWRAGTGNPCIICLGIPGSGKSFITSILVDYLRRFTNSRNREKIGLVYFYFDSHNPNDQMADDFVRSILKQLLYHDGLSLPKSLTGLYDTVMKQGQTAEPDTDKLVSILGDFFRSFDKVFVLVDAFDECSEDVRPAIMSHLRKLPQGLLRLFLTGRNGVFETRNLHDDDELQYWLAQTLMIPMKASDEDIYLYLNEELDKRARSLDAGLKEQIVTSIRAQAVGQILLAQYQLNYVLHSLSQPRKLVEALKHLPKTIDEVYNDVLCRIGSNDPNKCTDKELAMRTLAWIFYTADRPGARPLQMRELQDLLVTEPGDTQFQSQYLSSPSDIIAACQGLVILRDEDNDTVGFSHFTIHEFLRNCKELPDRSYIANVCLTFLSFPELEAGMAPTEDALKERIGKFRAAEFIAGHLGFFLKEVEQDIEIQKTVLNLLSSELRFRSIIEMEASEYNKLEGWDLTWDEWQEHVRYQKIILYLARQGLTKTLTSFIDGEIGTESPLAHRDIEAKSNRGRTALHYGARYGHFDVVKILLDRNANVNARANFGETPLLMGILHHDIAMLVIEHGAEVNIEWTDSGISPLHRAASLGDIELIKKLLEKGANVNKLANLGLTAVQWSTFQSNPEVVKLLIEHGADIQIKAANGMTALHFAVFHSVFDIVWLLSDITLQRQSAGTDHVLNAEKAIGPKQEVQAAERFEFLSRICQVFQDDHIYAYIAANELWDASQHNRAVDFFHRVLELDPVNANLSDINALQHCYYFAAGEDIYGSYMCDGCEKPVVGLRYSCKQCGDYDLCSECYPKPSWPDHESKDVHELVRIPRVDWAPKCFKEKAVS